MEIYSLRYTSSLLHKDAGKDRREQPFVQESTASLRPEPFVAHLEKVESTYAEISPRQLRELAREGLEAGSIDTTTYQQLTAELPMETIDQQGRVIDLTAITDETRFAFRDYYRDQLAIAENLGDDQASEIMKSALAFLEA